MPQRPIPNYWRERIKSEIARLEQQTKRVSDKAIRVTLQEHAEDLKRDPFPETRALAESVPSARTIARIRQNEWPQTPKEERAQYREFYWPESMERGDLPWEAGAAALELLRHLDMAHYYDRPSIRSVRWFWRVSQAVPDAPFEHRITMTARLMAVANSENINAVRGLEWALAYGKWRSPEMGERYLEARRRDQRPIPHIPELRDVFEFGSSNDEAAGLLWAATLVSIRGAGGISEWLKSEDGIEFKELISKQNSEWLRSEEGIEFSREDAQTGDQNPSDLPSLLFRWGRLTWAILQEESRND